MRRLLSCRPLRCCPTLLQPTLRSLLPTQPYATRPTQRRQSSLRCHSSYARMRDPRGPSFGSDGPSFVKRGTRKHHRFATPTVNFFSIRARAEPPRPLDCNKHFCANQVIYDRARRGCRAHEEAEGGSAPSNHVARWCNHLPRVCASSSSCRNMLLWHRELCLLT